MPDESLLLLREALVNLAAKAELQEQRLAGAVIQDELALDFDNAYQVYRARGDDADPVLGQLLAVINGELSAPPADPLWSENLRSARWSRLRALAREALKHLPGD